MILLLPSLQSLSECFVCNCCIAYERVLVLLYTIFINLILMLIKWVIYILDLSHEYLIVITFYRNSFVFLCLSRQG